MIRQIRFNAFDMNCFGHRSPPLWAHSLGRSWQYKDLEHWADAAQMLERGIFDGIFIADVMGYHDVYQGSPRGASALFGLLSEPRPLLAVKTAADAKAFVTEATGEAARKADAAGAPYFQRSILAPSAHLAGARSAGVRHSIKNFPSAPIARKIVKKDQ